MGIASPLPAESIEQLVDWLELSAVLCASRVRLDALTGALGIAADNDNARLDDMGDFDTRDQRIDSLLSEVFTEIERRKHALKDAYPFSVSSSGEAFRIASDLNYGSYAYLVCLILHHHWSGSGKLEGEFRATATELAEGRNILEVFGVFALHSVVEYGHVFYVGRNRRSQEGLLEILQSACDAAGTAASTRHPQDIPAFAPKAPNDDQVDIIAIHAEPDGPPPRNWTFVQVAAGKNYPDKGLAGHMNRFFANWFSMPPVGFVTVMAVPYLVDADRLEGDTRELGSIYHRLRLPRRALEGYSRYEATRNGIHFVDDPRAGCSWFEAYQARVCAEGAHAA